MSKQHAADAPADVITSAGAGSLEEARKRREQFAELEVRKRDLNAQIREVQAEQDALEERVHEDFIELGTDSMRVTVNGTTYTQHLAPDLWGGALKSGTSEKSGDPESTDDDWKRAVKAVRQSGAAHLIQERFNAQSFSAWLRSFRDEHGPGWQEHLPPGMKDAVRIDERVRVRMRKVS